MRLNNEILQSETADNLVLSLTTAMDLDDGHKLNHCWRVAVIAEFLARRVLPSARAEVFLAGLLHEVGGIGSSMHMLHFAIQEDGDPSAEPEIFMHPYHGAEFIRAIPGLQRRHLIADIVLQHHENWDGSGFPSKLSGDDIMPESQIVRLADQFDAFYFDAGRGAAWQTTLQRLQRWDYASPHLLGALTHALAEGHLLPTLRDDAELQAAIEAGLNEHRKGLFRTIDSATLVEGLFVLAAYAIDRKHPYTYGHSRRVSAYAAQIGACLGLDEDDVQRLRYGGYVHDIGKLGVPRRILDSNQRLGTEDWAVMKNHAQLSWDLLNAFSALKPFAFAALHHERWDGKGYPLGWRGADIPLLSRILSVADALDGMTSVRSYRPVWTFRRAMQEILSHAGTQFDPEIARAAVECYARDEYAPYPPPESITVASLPK
jgi:HD-GYP domain-containing protein (c-di-GMP phosphodiesterase class II)